MNCQQFFSAIERLELCTGSEILTMAKHFAVCNDCRRSLREIAQESEQARGFDKELTQQLTRDTLQRVARAKLDPEINTHGTETTEKPIPRHHY